MNTAKTCAICGSPLTRYQTLVDSSYCSRECYQQARRIKKDESLAYVKEHINISAPADIAKNLGITPNALAERIKEWRKNGVLDHAARPYNARNKKEVCSKYFDWGVYENKCLFLG